MLIAANNIVSNMKNQNINNEREVKKMISDWERQEERPSILIHSCGATCSTYTLELLTEYADVAIYFANPNIHPKAEYQRRAKVQEDFVTAFNEKMNTIVKYMEAP